MHREKRTEAGRRLTNFILIHSVAYGTNPHPGHPHVGPLRAFLPTIPALLTLLLQLLLPAPARFLARMALSFIMTAASPC